MMRVLQVLRVGSVVAAVSVLVQGAGGAYCIKGDSLCGMPGHDGIPGWIAIVLAVLVFIATTVVIGAIHRYKLQAAIRRQVAEIARLNDAYRRRD